MPKRVIDGEAIWTSRRLRRMGIDALPALYYVWLLPLGTANGVFECEPRLIWRTCFSWYEEWKITEDEVEEILSLFEQRGLLYRWSQDGRSWGYWTGMEKPGRLPPASQIERKNQVCGPNPPKKQLLVYQRKHGWKTTREQQGNNKAVTRLGSGSGSGSGSGKQHTLTSFAEFWQAYPSIAGIRPGKAKAEKAWNRLKEGERTAALAALPAHKATEQWQKEGGQFIPHASTWLNQRRWEDEIRPTGAQKEANTGGRQCEVCGVPSGGTYRCSAHSGSVEPPKRPPGRTVEPRDQGSLSPDTTKLAQPCQMPNPAIPDLKEKVRDLAQSKKL